MDVNGGYPKAFEKNKGGHKTLRLPLWNLATAGPYTGHIL